ncbi:OPT domain-containing protein [Cephalotus follicularis]|uniref:OPT domain-containing protein n=1 Tax=Cephalotus follicularis TaxID=3775 RepID=A0A1Q3BAH9_CEPFO|nr:OPT domain-containing protein [Cephalotus follicularis]
MKLNLTTGLVLNLNVSVSRLALVFIKTWTTLLQKARIVSTPFTRQESTVIHTCAVACYSISVGGCGFGYYLLGLNRKSYAQSVFVSIALILGDGLYNFLKKLFFTARSIHAILNNNKRKTYDKNQAVDDLRRNEVFTRDSIPIRMACVGSTVSSVISIIVIPFMFPELKGYYVVVASILILTNSNLKANFVTRVLKKSGILCWKYL